MVTEEINDINEYDNDDNVHYNAFSFPVSSRHPTLSDIQRHFPLGSQYHFTFQCASTSSYPTYIDLLHPSQHVPFYEDRIIAKVFPLLSTPTSNGVIKGTRPRLRSSSMEKQEKGEHDVQTRTRKSSRDDFDLEKRRAMEGRDKGWTASADELSRKGIQEAKKKAQAAKKWTGALFSSISSSMTNE